MKKIAFITTARSEYNASKWVIKAIDDDSELELLLFVGGIYWGWNDNYKIIPIGNFDANDKNFACLSLSIILKNMSIELEKYKPDLLIVNGDRIELMPIILTASIHGIPIAHIGGGDITDGSLDNETRYAISRYAHLHFVSDHRAAANLINSGEEPWRVCVAGQCGLENIIRTEKLSLEATSEAVGLDLSLSTAVCIYYPSREINVSVEEQIGCILNALDDKNMQTVFIYPCAEIGGDIIRSAIDEYCKIHNNCKAYPNFGNKLFQSLLWYSAFMIGNSSAGVIEAPFINKRSINVGSRQRGRNIPNMVFECYYSSKFIKECIEYCLNVPIKPNITDIEFPSIKIVQAIKENISKYELLHKKILLGGNS